MIKRFLLEWIHSVSSWVKVPNPPQHGKYKCCEHGASFPDTADRQTRGLEPKWTLRSCHRAPARSCLAFLSRGRETWPDFMSLPLGSMLGMKVPRVLFYSAPLFCGVTDPWVGGAGHWSEWWKSMWGGSSLSPFRKFNCWLSVIILEVPVILFKNEECRQGEQTLGNDGLGGISSRVSGCLVSLPVHFRVWTNCPAAALIRSLPCSGNFAPQWPEEASHGARRCQWTNQHAELGEVITHFVVVWSQSHTIMKHL